MGILAWWSKGGLTKENGRRGFCKEGRHTLTGVAQLAGHCPTKGNVVGSIPGQGTCLGCGPGGWLGPV